MIKQIARKWDISVGVALIRPPVIAPKMTDVEQKYNEFAIAEEHEHSLMSNFEVQMLKDKELLEKRKKLEEEGKDLSQLDEEIKISTLQQELEWTQLEEATRKRYKLGDVHTVQSNDPRSLRFCLDKNLVLAVQQKFDSSVSPWILPQLKNSGETLRQTVERCLGETFSSDVNITINGNAPMSLYRYKYPKPLAERLGADCNLIFIYSAYINELDRQLKFNDMFIKDYRWCTRDELSILFANRSQKYINKIRLLMFE